MTNLHRRAIDGLPDSLLEDCLLDMGRRGSGKSFLFRVAMERALTKGMRAGWIDATGVGWGVTVQGSPKNLKQPAGPGYEVVVFGGDHGKIALIPTMGAALGKQLAKATFSWVLDISKFPSKGSRVRFMFDFLSELYEGCNEPLILFVDECDLWAPQQIMDKTGPAAQLIGIMDDIIRRGRVKGLSLWMSTQRPAAISKQVISQVEALITFKLVMPHDLDAAMLWINDHLDKKQAQEIRVALPSLQIGEAYIYLTDPKISIMRRQLPMIETLDTFGRPEKGSKGPSDKQMAAVNIEAIQAALGEIAKELDANDPAKLKKEIVALKAELSRKPTVVAEIPSEVKKAEYERGHSEGWTMGFNIGMSDANKAWLDWRERVRTVLDTPPNCSSVRAPEKPPAVRTIGASCARPLGQRRVPVGMAESGPITSGNFTGPERKIMTALAEWRAIGFKQPSREQVAIMAGYHMRTGSFLNALGSLRSQGMIEYGTGTIFLTDAGKAKASADGFSDPEQLHQRIRQMLDGPQTKVFDYLVNNALQRRVDREELAEKAGYHIRTGSFLNALGRLRTLTVLDYESPGKVYLKPWVFMEQES